MKPARLLIALTAVLAVLSCQDDWKFSTDTGYVLEFSADTVQFDTVFTGIASASAWFMAYNTNDVALRFDAIMGDGTNSPFRMNIDGEGGSTVTGLEIPAGDSLFCFVSVNIPQSDDVGLFSALDSIRFVMESGVVQNVKLSAQGQNAVRLRGKRIDENTTLTSRLPYLVYDTLYVAPGATLTLRPGTRLYFHQGAVLDVAGKLLAEGTPDSVILMRGDRLDLMLPELPYDLLAGQWGGIRLQSGSYGNSLMWCDIHGGEWGIKADSAGVNDVKLSVISSIIHNVTNNCIETTSCRIEVANSQITNAGRSCIDIAGGVSDFAFCTIAGFSLWSVGTQAVLLADTRDGISAPLTGASFNNCVITGRHETEFRVFVADSIAETAPYSVLNSLLMVRDTTDIRYRNVVFEKRKSKSYGASNFVDNTVSGYRSYFALDSLSGARGIADTLSVLWPTDLAGTVRPQAHADAGCYQYKPPIEK